jgi:hypothetical protein
MEKQFTSVMHIDKDTIENDVKERQICCPPDSKKWAANAFINAMERCAEKSLKGYCGSKTWSELSQHIYSKMIKYKTPIFVAADGSGFDTTQHECILIEFERVLSRFLDVANIIWDDRTSAQLVREAFSVSNILNVSVGRGAAKYQTTGTRASGDGWTTFANTILNLSYIKYTLKLAGIGGHVWSKGDDLLVIIEDADRSRFERAHARVYTSRKDNHTHGLGQVCKFVKYAYSLSDVDFLSAYFVLGPSRTIRMIRIPARVFQLTPWTLAIKTNTPDPVKEAKELCWNEGMCMLDWCEGLPIFDAYARMLIRVGKPTAKRLYDWGDVDRKWRKMSPEENQAWYEHTVVFLAMRYGIRQGDIDRIEAKFNQCQEIFATIVDPIFDLFMGEFSNAPNLGV